MEEILTLLLEISLDMKKLISILENKNLNTTDEQNFSKHISDQLKNF